METKYTLFKIYKKGVRFHLGSGINGNTYNELITVVIVLNYVRFHLGSGINGNVINLPPVINIPVGYQSSPLSSRKWN